MNTPASRLHASGEMAERIRAFDWSRTALGPLEGWSEPLRTVVDLVLASPLVASVAVGGDRLLVYNDVAARLYGERHPAALGRPLADTFADSYPAVAPFYDQVFAGRSLRIEAQPLAVGTTGGFEVFDAYLTPVRNADGAVIAAHMVGLEIGEKVRAEAALRESEAQLQVMVAELHHRTRNLIGVIGMIMRQILASSTSLPDFQTRFTERLEALSRAQSLLSRPKEERINLGDIVRLELDALGIDLASGRVLVEGEPVPLRNSAIRTLALAIHELATNARKYGALRGESGRLAVRWKKYPTDGDRRWLHLEWTETGIDRDVTETGAPLHKGGYGRKLIEEALPYTLRARTSYRLGADRLDCTIDMPLDR